MIKNSLQTQLICMICLIILITLASTGLISYLFISADYENKIKQNNCAMAQSLGANISQFMYNANTINEMLANEDNFNQKSVMAQKEFLATMTVKYPWFELLAYTDLQGNQIARSSGEGGNRAERPWFKRFMATQKSYVTNTYYSVTTESPITTIIHGIYNNSGNLTGIMMADIEVSRIQQMVENFNLGEGSYAYLLDGNGAVIAHPDRQQVTDLYNYKTLKKQILVKDDQGKMVKDSKNNEVTQEIPFNIADSLKIIVNKALAGEIGIDEFTDLDDESYICAYRPIVLPGNSDQWSLIVVQNKHAAMVIMESAMFRSSLIGMIEVIIALFMTIWFSKRITNPLTQIVMATNKIKDGDLSVRLGNNYTNEFGLLADNFNKMVKELADHSERMEELVNARTMELANANMEMFSMNQELVAVNEVLEDTNHRLKEENKIRCQTEAHLLLRERQYRAITGLINRSDGNISDALESILDHAVQLVNANAGYIGLFEDNGEKFRLWKCIGNEVSPDTVFTVEKNGLKAKLYQKGEIICIEAYQSVQNSWHDRMLSDLTSSVIMIPLKHGDVVQGILAVNWLDVLYIVNPDDLDGLHQFADLASMALERELTHKKISQMAFHDSLTGLPNRMNLQLYLRDELGRARCGKSSGVMLFIDIDDFKTINDNFGHSAGDNLLITASCHIVEAVGKDAFVARLGGDEFVVVIAGFNNKDDIAKIADEVTQKLCQSYEISNEKMHMSASVGVVSYPADGDIAEELLKKADSAMYAAKKAGRNCWRFYEPVLLEEAYERMRLTNGLRDALENNEFYLEYQPQCTALDGKIIGFEALVRWRSREYGIISPAKFIPLAEQSGLIVPIGNWIIREACKFTKRLAKINRADVRVAVNISSRQLMAENFLSDVCNIIKSENVNAGQLEFEITESVFIDSIEESILKLMHLRELNIRLALDDFGTGYSSLTYLKWLPVDVLKIDKSFIDSIAKDPIQLELVGAIVNLGQKMGLNIMVEGVETEEQLQILRDFGCEGIQGYIFSRPLPEGKAISLLFEEKR